MKLSRLPFLLIILAINTLIWGFINKPHTPSESGYPVDGLSLNPYQHNQSPFRHEDFTPEALEEDFKKLEGKTKSVRLYSATGGLQAIPSIAKKHGINVVVSAWLENKASSEKNDFEVSEAIRIAGSFRNVKRIIIGNETQLHQIFPRDQLINYLEQARQKLNTPVSTAEPWDFWVKNPDFIQHVDFIAIHILPYWQEIPIENSASYVAEKYLAVKNLFPHNMVYIAETGWPSDGPQRGAAQATLANQARFIREFINLAAKNKIPYNMVEAFDQPWKSETEGKAGEHWGIMDAYRNDKFPLQGPVLEDPNWKYWAFSSTFLGFLAAGLFLFRKQTLNLRGQIISIVIFQVLASLITQLARDAADEYMSPGDILFWAFMISVQVLLAIILVTDTLEIADVVGQKPLKKTYPPIKNKDLAKSSFVSIHLACCREPPSMVIATIESLANLNYKNFEVIVVDNNTKDSTLWLPVEEHCKKLGEKFRFFSLGAWPGFKAGALNFALRITDPRAEIIAVVDADYIVEPNWLSSSVPYFSDSEVGVVQAPQEHREWEGTLFQKMENDEYSGFFRIGMVQRNEYNAIIQHGTMTLVRKEPLVHMQGWAEWCICEDTELGFRILNEGKKAIYINHAFGRGLVPDTYEAYAKQRFRWAFGGMKIFRHYWREIFTKKGKLSWNQRYQFLKGWLPWLGDALHMVFTYLAIVWSTILVFDPLHTDFPEAIFIYPALICVFVRITGTLWTYSARVKIGTERTLMAMIAGGSLTHKVAKGVFQGLLGFEKPFYRTPKLAKKLPLVQNLQSVWEELFLLFVLLSFALAVLTIFGLENNEAILWGIALCVQSIPYMAALAAAVVSGFSNKKQMVMDPTFPS